MRSRRLLLLASALVVSLFPAVGANAQVADEWEFDGGGWGHGIGMSQYGAQAQALEGRTAEQILQFYYTGTAVQTPIPGDHWVNDPHGVVVGLVPNTAEVRIEVVGAPIEICEPKPDCDEVQMTMTAGEVWSFERHTVEGQLPCRWRLVGGSPEGYQSCSQVTLTTDAGTANRIRVGGREYPHGEVRVVPTGNNFHVVVALDLETYLYGLAEVPSSWHHEALKAQAIAGRGYGFATAVARGGADGSQRLSSCGCHLRSTSVDQVYSGWTKENPANEGDRWKAAVDDSAGKVLTHPNGNGPYGIVSAYYSSSNGGASENNEDVWGGAPLPWLRSVQDPYSTNSINPLATWTVVVPTSRIRGHFGWDAVIMVEMSAGPPGSMVKFTGRRGPTTVTSTLSGTQMRAFFRDYGYRRDGGPVRVSPYISDVRYAGGFIDSVDHLFARDIVWLRQNSLTAGCNPPDNDRYCPDRSVTRGEMAVFLMRALELPPASEDHFDDDDGAFYEDAANRMFEAGITVGCDPRAYCGDDPIPREQMAAFLDRAFDLPQATADHFVDDNGSIFEGNINRIAETGITRGCNPPANDRFCPDDPVTRGQIAAFLRRALGN